MVLNCFLIYTCTYIVQYDMGCDIKISFSSLERQHSVCTCLYKKKRHVLALLRLVYFEMNLYMHFAVIKLLSTSALAFLCLQQCEYKPNNKVDIMLLLIAKSERKVVNTQNTACPSVHYPNYSSGGFNFFLPVITLLKLETGK